MRHSGWNGFSGGLSKIASLLLVGFLVLQGVPCRVAMGESLKSDKYERLQQEGISDDDLLLCLVRLADVPLTRDLSTYMRPDGKLLLPLGELGRLLEFAITIDTSTGRAEGHAARPGEQFLLDTKTSSISVKGRASIYDTYRVVVLPDDIYVESGLLAEWLSMRIEADRLDASIDIRPFEPLPLQQRLARERRGSNTWGYGSWNDPGYPHKDSHYSLLGGPGIDMSFFTSLTGNGKDIRVGDSRFFGRISGDLLWMNGSLDLSGYIAGNRSVLGVENGRLIMERVDPDGSLLGVLGARRIAFGDIDPSALPLIGGSLGPGVMVSSYPIMQSQLFDLVTLRGFLGAGWDVELYRNGSVLDYRPSNSEELYVFADIPLVFGLNELQLVFNGPQGERKSETHRYYVGQNMIEPGRWAYQITLSEPSGSSIFSSKGVTRSSLASPMMTWKSDIGLNKWLTSSQYLAWLPDGTERERYYAGIGFSGYLQMMQVDVQVANDYSSEKWAKQAAMITKIGPLSFSFQWQEFDHGWKSVSGTAAFRRRVSGRIEGFRPIPFSSSSSISLGGERIDYDDNRHKQRYSLTSTNRTFGVNHTHRLAFERVLDGAGVQDALSGYSYASISRRNLSFRLEADYRMLPDKSINSVMAGTELRLQELTLATGTLSYTPSPGSFALSLGLNHIGRDLSIGVKGGYATTGMWDIGMQLTMSLIREPRRGRWLSAARAHGRQGSVSARVFLDKNLNRERDDDEPLLEDVGFFVNLQNRSEITDSSGTVLLRGLAPHVPANISILQETLGDLFRVPADKGARVVPRPGIPVRLDFPVWGTGEVSGIVYTVQGGIRKKTSGIVIEAIDGEGTVVARKISEFDGFYVLDKLPPGDCTLRVSPEQTARFGVSVAPRKVAIDSGGSAIDNIDFELFYSDNQVFSENRE